MYVLVLSAAFIWNFSQTSRNSEGHYRRLHVSSCEVPVFLLSDFKQTWI